MDQCSSRSHGENSVVPADRNFSAAKIGRLIVGHIHPPFDEGMYIYTKYITLRNGKRLYAAHYGLKAFRLKVRRSNKRR